MKVGRVTRWGLLCALGLVAGVWSVSTRAQEGLPGRDIRSWATADVSSLLSFGGTWAPFDFGSGPTSGVNFVGPFWSPVRLGGEQREGVALAGWVYSGSFSSTLPDNTVTQMALLVQQPDGTLVEASAERLGNTASKGIGGIIAGDFNADGLQDVFYSAHNESPCYLQHSVAFMSQPDGSLRRVDVADTVMNHQAQLYRVGGVDKIISATFGAAGNGQCGGGGGVNQYTWNGRNFDVARLGNAGLMSVTAGAFTADERNWVITGEITNGPGFTSPLLVPRHLSWRLSDNTALRRRLLQPPGDMPKPYFDDKPEYAEIPSFRDPYAKTHTPRVFKTDLNQDGLPDVLALATIWQNGTDGNARTMLQLMFNQGEMRFADVTDALLPEINIETTQDHGMQLRDIDSSGIDTVFLSSKGPDTAPRDDIRQGNYILVNDGTGRLYSAMHDEFHGMGSKVSSFLRGQNLGGFTPNTSITPQFVAYRTPEGALNFVAIVRLSATGQPRRFGFVNVPLGVNLTTDFRRDITIPGRNGSRRIRTFAGNDTIARALADPDCTINGGLGTDVVVYPGSMRDWSLQRQGTTVLISHRSGTGGTDRLSGVEIARFDDGDVPLTE